jgi:hypothetical protein
VGENGSTPHGENSRYLEGCKALLRQSADPDEARGPWLSCRQAGKQASRQAGKQASRQAGKQASRQAGKQASRQAGKHRVARLMGEAGVLAMTPKSL